MWRTSSKPAVLIAVVGIVLVAAYAALGALQLLVFNPIAAAPELTLDEIHTALAAAGESVSPVPVIIFVWFGLVLACGVGVYATTAPTASPVLVAVLLLLILAFGTPAYFVASFSAGMALADTFFISGGDHSSWSTLLYVTSATSLACAIVLPVALTLRTRSTTHIAHDR
jgi:hypothetical protein